MSGPAGIRFEPAEPVAWRGVPPRQAMSDGYPKRADDQPASLGVSSPRKVETVRLHCAARRSGRALQPRRAACCWFVARRGPA